MSAAENGVNGVLVFVVDADGAGAPMVVQRDAEGQCGAALRSVLGCRWFDVVRLADRLDMWVDDEGATVADPEVNVVATRIARYYGFTWQPYMGRVVFASSSRDGETVGLSEEQCSALAASVSEWGGCVVAAAAHPAGSAVGVVL